LLTFETKLHKNSVVCQNANTSPKFHMAIVCETERTDDFRRGNHLTK